MRKNLVAAGGAAAAVIVVLAVTLSGVLAPSSDGTAVPDEQMQALQGLVKASTSLADAPAVKYNGTITSKLDSGSVKIKATDLTVTAAGDVHGDISMEGNGSAEWLQIAGQTYARGDKEFWQKRPGEKQPAGVFTEESPTGKWVAVDEATLGIDLRDALRPARLGAVLRQQDTSLGGTEVKGTPLARGSETPDRRVNNGVDPVGVSEVEVEDADGGVEGVRRYQATAMTVGVDDDGAAVAVRGPLGKGFGGDLAMASADLTVSPVDDAGIRDFYSTAKGLVQTGKLGSREIVVADPDGGLDCGGSRCVVTYNLSNTTPGLARGTVDVALTSSMTSNGRDIGKCDAKGTMPVNGRGRVTCSVRFPENADVNSSSRMTVTVNGEVDPAVLDAAAKTGITVSESAKGWAMTAPKATEEARRFNHQIALVPSGYVYKVGDFAFDGREKDGTLLLTYGPGYDAHVGSNGALDAGWAGTQQLAAQARDARAAAGDKPVRMVFAEARTADAVRGLLAADNVQNVEVVTVPLYADSL
ncbi:hypothetical protein L5G32_01270 [Gordonia sp. HY002]|uniref:hypothetical protein n=1 Tax=Gordonia zhenghanii TaxID=2911516 RepID=UPI001EF0D70D|nr:hypothetical protein [Gordonia zhenghanii]MCF8568895.1 hypothetical protein [Gordonia zhenghanii]MCF8602990.1 hypothetical protein [Gordonia zhenghanii]